MNLARQAEEIPLLVAFTMGSSPSFLSFYFNLSFKGGTNKGLNTLVVSVGMTTTYFKLLYIHKLCPLFLRVAS